MEREIVFRGRDKAGNWAEGFYCVFNGNAHRIYSGYAETDGSNYRPDYTIVTPKTVGQYTGLDDMNGRRIFEGDIVLLNGNDEPYRVVFDEGCFQICNDICYNMDSFYSDEIEVIGNVYDNPELIKEG